MKFRPAFRDESEATARKARRPEVAQHLPTNGPGNKQPLRLLLQDGEKNANESQFRRMQLLLLPLHKKHLSIRKEKNGQHFCLFKLFPHDVFREIVPGPPGLLFCHKSNSNNPICVPAALLFHPQQMCLQACVNHEERFWLSYLALVKQQAGAALPPHGLSDDINALVIAGG